MGFLLDLGAVVLMAALVLPTDGAVVRRPEVVDIGQETRVKRADGGVDGENRRGTQQMRQNQGPIIDRPNKLFEMNQNNSAETSSEKIDKGKEFKRMDHHPKKRSTGGEPVYLITDDGIEEVARWNERLLGAGGAVVVMALAVFLLFLSDYCRNQVTNGNRAEDTDRGHQAEGSCLSQLCSCFPCCQPANRGQQVTSAVQLSQNHGNRATTLDVPHGQTSSSNTIDQPHTKPSKKMYITLPNEEMQGVEVLHQFIRYTKKKQNIAMKNLGTSGPLLVPVIISSRVGSDVNAALGKIPKLDGQPHILVLFHHKAEHNSNIIATKDKMADFVNAARDVIDVAFWNNEVYECDQNDRASRQLKACLKAQAQHSQI